MRRLIPFLPAAVLVLAAVPASAKPAFLKKAKEAGITQVTSCKSCHAEKMSKDSLNDAGKWLMKEMKEKKAKEVDPTWLKEYYSKKK